MYFLFQILCAVAKSWLSVVCTYTLQYCFVYYGISLLTQTHTHKCCQCHQNTFYWLEFFFLTSFIHRRFLFSLSLLYKIMALLTLYLFDLDSLTSTQNKHAKTFIIFTMHHKTSSICPVVSHHGIGWEVLRSEKRSYMTKMLALHSCCLLTSSLSHW